MQYLLHILPYRMLTSVIMLFCLCVCLSLIFIISASLFVDLADKDDILADKYNDPHSFYDGTYELPRNNIRKAMIYANLSYHTFWNAVVMFRYRICMHTYPQIYSFRVNRFRNQYWNPLIYIIKRPAMFFSFAFIWGYPIFLLIMLLRMCFYSKDLS